VKMPGKPALERGEEHDSWRSGTLFVAISISTDTPFDMP
jgi:hypothetical protein